MDHRELANAIVNATYTNASAYKPSLEVRMLHSLPHIGSNGYVKDPSFQFSPSAPMDGDYLSSLFFFPVFLALCGLAVLLYLQVGLWGACPSYLFPRMGPISWEDYSAKSDNSENNHKLWGHNTYVRRRTWEILFWAVMIVSVLMNHLIFVGNAQLQKGYNSLHSDAQHLNDALTTVETNVGSLFAVINVTEIKLYQSFATCPPAVGLKNVSIDYRADLASFEADVSQVTSRATAFINESNLIFGQMRDWLVYGMYAFVFLSNGLLIAAYWLMDKNFMNLSIIYTQVISFVLIVYCTILLLGLMGLSDFCMNPTQSIVNSLEGKAQDVAKYYAGTYYPRSGNNFCGPVQYNPVHMDLSKSYEVRTKLGVYMNSLFNTDPHYCGNHCVCPNNVPLEASFRTLQSMHTTYETIDDEIKCSRIQPIWIDTLHTATCGNFFQGFYSLWLTQGLALISLFVASVVSSNLMFYFGKYWEIKDQFKKDPDGEGDPSETEGMLAGVESSSSTSAPLESEEIAPKEYIPVNTQKPFSNTPAKSGASGYKTPPKENDDDDEEYDDDGFIVTVEGTETARSAKKSSKKGGRSSGATPSTPTVVRVEGQF